ncbi:Hepatocyte growth factor receptor [Orchesella cincta]|uniref:Hepatocyte growth factor receptor n=1 Tax=Orchesella cincta TaxID=48709 RepID=A0A1D2M1S6_ORCCI|nr:Hepatocyte growth factor receptor [Orchesella cincta]
MNFFGPVHIHTFNNNMYTNDVGAQVRSSSRLTQAPPLDNALISQSAQPTPAIPLLQLKHRQLHGSTQEKVTKSVPAQRAPLATENGVPAHLSD